MPVPYARTGLSRLLLGALAGTAALAATVVPTMATASTGHGTVAGPAWSPFAAVAAGARADGTPGGAAAAVGTRSAVATAAAAGTATPPTPTGLPSTIEAWPVPYEPQTSCDPTAKPGVVAFQNLLTTTYGPQYDGIGRTCYIGSTSEHEEGRALDWGIDARSSTEYAQGMQVVSWLMAPDAAGNPDAMARRLGIMYVIFNAKILGFWDSTPTWEPYSCSGVTACHIDHMHFSFTWDGALARTSYWSKQTVTSPDYGPCRVSGLAWAPQRIAGNYAPCRSVAGPPPVPTAPAWYATAAAWSGVTLRSGSTGSAVSALQAALGQPPTGSFGGSTLYAVQSVQRSRGLPTTGVTDPATWLAVLARAGRANHAAPGDFTGDGRSDVAIFRPSTGEWAFLGHPSVHYGQAGDIPVPGDYDGNGTADVALFRPSTGEWAFLGHPSVHYGQAGDIPVPGDYNGDGTTDIAIFRPSTGEWAFLDRPSVHYGQAGDIPVPGDYNGDGTTDIAIFRPSTGEWAFLDRPSVHYGQAGDIPVPGDYNGDGTTDIAIFRPSTGEWAFLDRPSVHYGQAGDVPLAADYDGNGTADIALFRPSTGQWAFRGQPTVSYGQAGDIPQPGDYDGNGTADVALFRPSTGQWAFRGQPTVSYGQAGDIPLVAILSRG